MRERKKVRRVNLDPNFESFCFNLKQDVTRTLKQMMPNQDIKIRNTQIQRIIANMNNNGIKIRLKKIPGKRRRFKLLFDDKTF